MAGRIARLDEAINSNHRSRDQRPLPNACLRRLAQRNLIAGEALAPENFAGKERPNALLHLNFPTAYNPH